MGKVLRSVLIGIGIGLLIAPMPGQELRQLLRSRMQQLLGSNPMNNGSNVYGQQMSTPTSKTESDLKRLGESAMNTKAPNTLTSESPGSFAPAYPEYVNPEQTPKQ